MPSSLIDRSFHGNSSSRRTASTGSVDGLPGQTFSTLRMSVFEGLDARPSVEARPFSPSSIAPGIEGLTRHPDAPKPFSFDDIFGGAGERARSFSPVGSRASEFAMALAEQSRALSPKATNEAGEEYSNPFEGGEDYGYDEYYGDEGYYGQGEDENMADDEYYPSPPISRISPRSSSIRTSKFLNSSDFAPTAETLKPTVSVRTSRFHQPARKQQPPAVVPKLATESSISSESVSFSPYPSAIVASSQFVVDTSSDSATSDSDMDGGNTSSSSISEPAEPVAKSPPVETATASHHPFGATALPLSLFIPTTSPATAISTPFEDLKFAVDEGIKAAVEESFGLANGFRSAIDEAFSEVSSFIGQGISRFSQLSSSAVSPSTSGFGVAGWMSSKVTQGTNRSSVSPGAISRILMDFFAAREQQRS